MLGLDICADIIIGDEMIRGISGGQKKRVTTGMNIKPVCLFHQFIVEILIHFVFKLVTQDLSYSFPLLCRGDVNGASKGFVYGRNIHWTG